MREWFLIPLIIAAVIAAGGTVVSWIYGARANRTNTVLDEPLGGARTKHTLLLNPILWAYGLFLTAVAAIGLYYYAYYM